MSENLETFAATLRAEDAAVRVPDANLEWRRLERTISGRNAGAKRSRIAWLAIPASLAGAAAIALYVGAGNREPSPNAAPQRMVARQAAAPVSTAGAPSTVVYVDDKSGWTFVWSSDSGGGRNI